MDTLEEIEDTLDRLIENQSTLNNIRKQYKFNIELEALVKTQESLQAHLFFLSDIYDSIQTSIKSRLSARLRERVYQKALHYQRQTCFSLPPVHRLFQPSSFRIRKNRKKKVEVAVMQETSDAPS